MNHFCTITTYDHLYKVFALRDSLLQFDQNITLHVLITDGNAVEVQSQNIKTYAIGDINSDEIVNKIAAKYAQQKDRLRWSLKPCFLKFLLQREDITKVIYLDNDLFFFNDYSFLFNELNEHAFLLTPHYYDRSPKKDQNWLEANFRAGLFNAGFIAVNKNAVNTLQWWAECCLYRCKKSAFRGTFDDQKYLDLIPVMREDAMILRHQGCNVAEWNRFLCIRQVVNGQVLINGTWPIVFIHFNYTTIREIISGTEPHLVSYFDQYFQTLKKYKPSLQQADLYKPVAKTDWVKYFIWRILTSSGL
jgi:lipopolysaccharide biosynthesis glycosyltransferase